MKTFTFLMMLVVVLADASFGGIPSLNEDFEAGYTEGQTFLGAVNGWQASGPLAYVTNSGGYGGTRAVVLGEIVALTNTLNTDPNLKVWTDVRVKPVLGGVVPDKPSSPSSFLCYFDREGVMMVATASGWLVCTNDIFGNPVDPATNNAYVRVSVFQDYTTSNQAVFLNDQLLVQDLGFMVPAGTYSQFLVQNNYSNGWLDNVWVNTLVTGLASNRNADAEGLPEAEEVQRYGYARRTLYVNGPGTPSYSSIQAAVNAWRPRDSIYVPAGAYAETVTITNNVAFEGQTFSVPNLAIAAGASPLFAQSLSCGTLTVSGQVTMASGASVTATTAVVVGNLVVPGSGAFVVTSLAVGASGTVNAGTYAQNVTMSDTAAFGGQLYSVGNLTVVSGASVTFAQAVNCTGTLAITGQVTIASGVSLSAATALVVGSLSLSGNGAFVVTALDFGGAGVINLTQAQLVASAAGVVMNGTFAITGTTIGSSFGNISLSGNVAFGGAGFTVTNLTVASGASVTFSQSVNCASSLVLTGQLMMATGASLTSITATVVGRLTVSTNGSFVVTSLDVGSAGIADFMDAQLVASQAGVVMNGTFAISNTWGAASVVSMPLPFSDNFDLLYPENQVVTNLKFRGWYASDGTVKIQSAVANAGKAVVLPDGTVLSNSISTAATKIWTDTYLRPTLGVKALAQATASSSFLTYVNPDGYLVVATNGGGWVVCSNQLGNTLATPLRADAFTRVTVCQDLSVSPPKFAVFVAGKLVAQELSSPANISRYSSFVAENRDGSAYVDDVLITTSLPPDLGEDLDKDGNADAYEINNYGSTTQPDGSIFSIR